MNSSPPCLSIGNITFDFRTDVLKLFRVPSLGGIFAKVLFAHFAWRIRLQIPTSQLRVQWAFVTGFAARLGEAWPNDPAGNGRHRRAITYDDSCLDFRLVTHKQSCNSLPFNIFPIIRRVINADRAFNSGRS